MYFKINNVDLSNLVSGMKVGYETLVDDTSGRNANGDMTFNVINRKAKVYITFRHTTDAEMKKIMGAIAPFEMTVQYRSPETGALASIYAYTGTPEPEYYTIQNGFVVYKPMTLNFIEK